MKKSTSILALLCICLIPFSCTDSFDEEYSETAYFESERTYKNISARLPDCVYPFGDYGDAKKHNRVSGVIVEKQETLLIKFYDVRESSVRLLAPCNLPGSFIKGQRIRFSGIEKIPPPHVRLIAPVIRLVKIKK